MRSTDVGPVRSRLAGNEAMVELALGFTTTPRLVPAFAWLPGYQGRRTGSC